METTKINILETVTQKRIKNILENKILVQYLTIQKLNSQKIWKRSLIGEQNFQSSHKN